MVTFFGNINNTFDHIKVYMVVLCTLQVINETLLVLAFFTVADVTIFTE